MEHSLGWVAQCKDSVEALRADIKQAKSQRARCCQVLAAALAAQLALEHTVHLEGLSLRQAQALQRLCASTFAAIELAQQRVQDCNAQSGIVKYASLRRKQPVEQKFSEVTDQLNELAQQAWNLQREAASTPAGYQEDMYYLLGHGLTPGSARCTADALTIICKQLVSGRLAGRSLPPSLTSMQSGDAVTCEQAIEALNEIRFLLGADSGEAFLRSASSEVLLRQAADGTKSDKGIQTGPLCSNSHPPGPSGSFDSANSQDWQWPEAAGSSKQQPPSSAAVSRAPPPPTHAEHAERKPVQSGLLEEAVRSASSSLSAQASEQGEPEAASSAWGLEYSQDATLLQRSPSARYSPFDIPRRHTTHDEPPPMPDKPRRHSAEEQWRLSDWTGQQLSVSQKDTSGRHLSSFTRSQLYALQAHDRGRQGQAQEPHATTIPQHAARQRSLAEVDLPSYTPRSTSRRDDQDERYSSRGSSIEILEGLNCPIVEYNQLQIKRKIGDGSIGLVYLGKWQETDVAVKVLIEMQHLAPDSKVQPQDPATLEPWINSEEDNHPSQGGIDQKKAANGLIGLTASTLAGNSDPVLNKEETQAIKTLEREVSIMASLRHPNVVMFMGMCVEPPCIITEFCARGSLFDVLRKARTSPAFAQQLDWSRRLTMALDAAKGVLHLHSHKPTILHRDLKSPNMLVERHWRVKVTDFNLSRMVQTSSTGSSITSLLANNPRWLAPEVVADHSYSKAADVYSFGIILWELMTWDMPWEELNFFQIMLRLQAQDRPEIPPLHTLPGQPLPGIADYVKLMQACWSQDPSKRPGFEHVIVSIRGLLEGATNKQKLQKTLTDVPKMGTLSMVPPNMNRLPVVGQTPYNADGPDPQQTPSPLHSKDKQTPLQIYETDRPFFGSAPVGGLDILCSEQPGEQSPCHYGLGCLFLPGDCVEQDIHICTVCKRCHFTGKLDIQKCCCRSWQAQGRPSGEPPVSPCFWC
ncbi:TPA: hypothetical protein ACH3X1_006228 [Trebouxia sp. C0004]